MNEEKLKYQIGITLIPNIGNILIKKIIAYTGDVEAVFKEKKKNLLKITGIGEQIAKEITSQNVLGRAEEEIEFIKKNKIKVLYYLDADYPERLRHCEDCPIVLFVKGKLNFNEQNFITIVGTRNATTYGIEICERLIEELSKHGHRFIVVSGLAYGIDICAHRSALKNHQLTIAVLGHGLNTIYPSLHSSVARQIIEHGALVTEFLSNSPIDRKNFVKRNRIIAGLSDATIVIESGLPGGAIITAEIANSYNRDVFAFPGKTTDRLSRGCNYLIKKHKAALVEDAADIEYMLGWQNGNTTKKSIQLQIFNQLNDDEKKIIEILKNKGDCSIDIICIETGFAVSKVAALLLELEFTGLIRCLPGKIYSLIN